MPRATLQTLTVRRAARLPGESGPRGLVKIGTLTLACALGRAGIARAKREGDGATPVGRLRVLHGYYRPDRIGRPFCRVPLRPLGRDDGWCDDPASPAYNRPARLPMAAAHEVMWRDDGLYDVVFVLAYNIAPRRAGRGSAIFLHCATTGAKGGSQGCGGRSRGSWGLKPTLGCVALRPGDMRRLLGRLASSPELVIV